MAAAAEAHGRRGQCAQVDGGGVRGVDNQDLRRRPLRESSRTEGWGKRGIGERPRPKGGSRVPLAKVGKTRRTTDFCEEKKSSVVFWTREI